MTDASTRRCALFILPSRTLGDSRLSACSAYSKRLQRSYSSDRLPSVVSSWPGSSSNFYLKLKGSRISRLAKHSFSPSKTFQDTCIWAVVYYLDASEVSSSLLVTSSIIKTILWEAYISSICQGYSDIFVARYRVTTLSIIWLTYFFFVISFQPTSFCYWPNRLYIFFTLANQSKVIHLSNHILSTQVIKNSAKELVKLLKLGY